MVYVEGDPIGISERFIFLENSIVFLMRS